MKSQTKNITRARAWGAAGARRELVHITWNDAKNGKFACAYYRTHYILMGVGAKLSFKD